MDKNNSDDDIIEIDIDIDLSDLSDSDDIDKIEHIIEHNIEPAKLFSQFLDLPDLGVYEVESDISQDKVEHIIEHKIEHKFDHIIGPANSFPKYKNLVMSGGSVRGVSLIGAIKELIDNKLINLKKLKAVAGTSAGSMLGTLIVLGMSIEEIWEFVYNFDTGKMIKPNPLLFLHRCGVDTGQQIHNFFEDFITKKTGIKHINFRQLYELSKIHFTIVGTCLTTKEIVYFDHINTPNEKVSVALRISIGIPGFFMPFQIGDKKYIDGGVLNNYAMNLFDDKLDETIGIMICSEYDTNYKYPEEYFIAIINLLMYHFYQRSSEQYKNNTIYVKETCENVFTLNFDIDHATKTKLYQCGINAAKKFLQIVK